MIDTSAERLDKYFPSADSSPGLGYPVSTVSDALVAYTGKFSLQSSERDTGWLIPTRAKAVTRYGACLKTTSTAKLGQLIKTIPRSPNPGALFSSSGCPRGNVWVLITDQRLNTGAHQKVVPGNG